MAPALLLSQLAGYRFGDSNGLTSDRQASLTSVRASRLSCYLRGVYRALDNGIFIFCRSAEVEIECRWSYGVGSGLCLSLTLSDSEMNSNQFILNPCPAAAPPDSPRHMHWISSSAAMEGCRWLRVGLAEFEN